MKNENYWTPSREWNLQDSFLIGGGPSLKDFDFSRLRGRNVIGCNDAFLLGDIIKITVFGDAAWYHRNKWELEKFTGRLVTNAPSLTSFQIPGLLKTARERDGIHNGQTLGWNYSTGALAINLAVSLGALRIFLLGYDLNNEGAKSHWHDKNKKTTAEPSFQRFLRGFHMVKKCLPVDIDVVNVTNGSSRLDCFRKMSFEEFYKHLSHPSV